MQLRLAVLYIFSAFNAEAAGPLAVHGPAAPPSYIDPEPIEKWSGLYVGALVGYDWDIGVERTFSPSGVHNWPVPLTINTSKAGGISASIQMARNFQSDIFVWGVEVEGAFLSHANWRGRYVGPAGRSIFYGTEQTEGWLASVRARFGIGMDRWLVYGFSGPAAGSRSGGNPGSDVNGVLLTTLRPQTGFGFIVGAGSEIALRKQLSVKIEYAYSSLGSRSFSLGNRGWLGAGARYSSVQDGRNHAVRVGLNYRFH